MGRVVVLLLAVSIASAVDRQLPLQEQIADLDKTLSRSLGSNTGSAQQLVQVDAKGAQLSEPIIDMIQSSLESIVRLQSQLINTTAQRLRAEVHVQELEAKHRDALLAHEFRETAIPELEIVTAFFSQCNETAHAVRDELTAQALGDNALAQEHAPLKSVMGFAVSAANDLLNYCNMARKHQMQVELALYGNTHNQTREATLGLMHLFMSAQSDGVADEIAPLETAKAELDRLKRSESNLQAKINALMDQVESGLPLLAISGESDMESIAGAVESAAAPILASLSAIVT